MNKEKDHTRVREGGGSSLAGKLYAATLMAKKMAASSHTPESFGLANADFGP